MQNNTFSVEGLFDFLNAGVSAFHSTAAAVKILEENGYQNCPESAAWELVPGGRYYTTRNGSAVLAWRMPKGELTGWHVTASHSDSPTWRIKQLDGGKDAVFAKAETEGYGGMIMPTWLDRPLSVAGRILVRTENGIRSLLVHPDRALAVIPNLCIHFNRDLNNGMKYNPQVDLQPIFGEAGSTLRDALAEEAGVKAEDIVDADLVLCTREKAERVGLKGEYFMSGRIDDLECAYTTLWGFLQGRGEEEGRGDMWVMFDNEEVGSSSRQGAQGTLMANVLARIEEKLGVTREQSIRACTNSLLLSADNGHATHPNHPEKSDPANVAVMGGGVLLKYNARQTYTTSGFTDEDFVVLYCGRLDPDKGIHKLMEAIAALHEPHIKLLIVGSPFFARTQQSAFQRKLEQQAKSLGNRVQFTGYIPNEDLPDYYRLADLCCVPTLVEEAAGLVAVEAMACGRPVLATRSGGMPEYLAGSQAVLVERGDTVTDQLAWSIRMLYEHPALCTEMGAAGAARGREFSTAHYYEEFVRIVRDVTENGGAQ